MRSTASPRGCTANSITCGESLIKTSLPLLVLPPTAPISWDESSLTEAVHAGSWPFLLLSIGFPTMQQASCSEAALCRDAWVSWGL